MGIFNMFIVLPMLLQTLTFSTVYKYALGSDPVNAIRFAGVLLLLAAVAVFFVKVIKYEGVVQKSVSGH